MTTETTRVELTRINRGRWRIIIIQKKEFMIREVVAVENESRIKILG